MLGKSLSHRTIKFKMKLHVIILKMQQICFLYFFIATLAIWMHNLNGAALLLFEPPEPDWSFLLNGLQIAAAATVARCWMKWHPCIHAFRHGDTCSPCLNGRAYLGGGYSLKREREIKSSMFKRAFTYQASLMLKSSIRQRVIKLKYQHRGFLSSCSKLDLIDKVALISKAVVCQYTWSASEILLYPDPTFSSNTNKWSKQTMNYTSKSN